MEYDPAAKPPQQTAYQPGSSYQQPVMAAPPQQMQYAQAVPTATYVMAAPQQGTPQVIYSPNGAPMTTIVGQPGQPNTVVVVEQQIYFGRAPVNCVCPNCRANIITNVAYNPGAMSWLACLGLFIVGAWPCCLIPFCVPGCMDSIHTCPNCRVVIRRRDAFD